MPHYAYLIGMFDLLWQVFGHFADLSTKEQALLEDNFVFRQVPANYFLVHEGDIAHEFYFINKGLIRMYYNKDGADISAFFFTEGLFASSFDSMLTQSPSIQILETLEPTDLLVLSYEKLMGLYEVLPKMNVLTRKLVESRFINAQRILSSFILDSPETRYKKFIANQLGLLQRVPQHMIASFLGVTPVSLSRIRKRIADQERDSD